MLRWARLTLSRTLQLDLRLHVLEARMGSVQAILKGVMIVCEFLTKDCGTRAPSERCLNGGFRRSTPNSNLSLYYR